MRPLGRRPKLGLIERGDEERVVVALDYTDRPIVLYSETTMRPDEATWQHPASKP
jgi:hypothetical protein